MEPTDIDKSAGKRHGYIPDYSVWRNGFPLLIAEAKTPDQPIAKALREAQLYAGRINNRYSSLRHFLRDGREPVGALLQ